MPVTVKKQGMKWRVCEADSGNIAKNKNGVAVDGGGHRSKEKAKRQAAAINMHLKGK